MQLNRRNGEIRGRGDEKRPEEFVLTPKTIFDDPEKSALYWLQFPLNDCLPMLVNEARMDLSLIDSSLRLIVDEAKAGSIVVEGQMGKSTMVEWLERLVQRGEHLNNILSVMVAYAQKLEKPSDQ